MTAERQFPAELDELQNVIAFVEETLEQTDCPMKTQIQINIAVEEMFVNIAHYAYGDEKGDMKLCIVADGSSVSISFLDRGIPYDPLAKPDPDVTLSAEQRGIGGLGIFMVKKSMDEVRYEYKDGQNIFTMAKKF